MCIAFEAMIDKAEELYKVIVVAFCCDNDGGKSAGKEGSHSKTTVVVWTAMLRSSGETNLYLEQRSD